jgi:hypothetical protein
MKCSPAHSGMSAADLSPLFSAQSLDVAQRMDVGVLSIIHPYHAVSKPLLLFNHDGSIEWVSPYHQSRKTLINSEHVTIRAVQHQQL